MKNLKTFLVFMTLSFTQVYGNCDLDVKVLDPSIKLGKYNCSNVDAERDLLAVVEVGGVVLTPVVIMY